MIVKIRCGEKYQFYQIKSVTDLGNGVIEIVGNFKDKGRYKIIKLWKTSIINLDELTKNFTVEIKPYFCLKCKKIHKNGSVFEEHGEFMGKKEDLIPSDRIIKADTSKLREIGWKQLNFLVERMKLNPQKASLYRREINKLFLYEGIALENIIPED